MRLLTLKLMVLMAILLSVTACGEQSNQDAAMEQADPDASMEPAGHDATMETEAATDFSEAVAVFHPTEGNDASGTVTFSKSAHGIHVQAAISGLTQGLHGFHIHEFGDCRAADGTSAGGHYAPHEDSRHGAPDQPGSHAGDLGNIHANETGDATLDMTFEHITLNGAQSIIGRGLIIHASEDDLRTQPTGDAGARLACGVIGIANADQ